MMQKMRHFQPKQLADTVESITGAIALAAGLFSAQDFLLKVGVLKSSSASYEVELQKFLKNPYFIGPGYKYLLNKLSNQISALQDIIGYHFKNPCLLVQAMTHKSYKEQFNTTKEHQTALDMRIDDYERLEFLGDSILNFLIA
jgi:dsRNA-specific ribonuclease